MSEASQAFLLTGPGAAAIAVVRLTGPLTTTFLQRHFSRSIPPGRCVHGTLADGDRVIDDPVVVLLPGGAGADVNLHGGPWVVKSALELARAHGFAVIEPPSIPLPEEATDGRSAIEREMLSHLPLACTELAVRVLLSQPEAWDRLHERLGKGMVPPEKIAAILADRSMHHLLNMPRVAIVGAPNVGKSTLANQLFGQERSITADLPGTTRDWVGEIANIDGLAVMLVDTPGLRETDDAVERAAIERSIHEVKCADLILLVLDVSMPLEPQAPLLDAYPGAIRILNKSDQPRAWGEPQINGIPTVGTNGEGLDHVRSAILNYFGCHTIELDRARCWTDRQRTILNRAMKK